MSAERNAQLNLRLEEELVREIERAAKDESLDRATMVRRLLRHGLAGWRKERAILGYQAGRLSIGRAAEEAGLTQWELMDELRARHVAHPLSADEVDEWFREDEGFRTTIEWMGRSITTLADIPPDGGILIVGISPKQESIDAGHYYQGRLGRRLWRRLERAGLLQDPLPGREDEALHRSGHGLTDIVKRPLKEKERPSREELKAGAELLRGKVREWQPGLVLFVFKLAAEAALGEPIQPGPGPRYEDRPTFLLPSPYAKRSEADSIYEDLIAAWEGRLHLFNR